MAALGVCVNGFLIAREKARGTKTEWGGAGERGKCEGWRAEGGREGQR